LPSYRQLFRAAQEKVPTVSATLEVLRKPIQERGELVILYFNFDRYQKIEEIYGWEKLDEILETTTTAMRNAAPGGWAVPGCSRPSRPRARPRAGSRRPYACALKHDAAAAPTPKTANVTRHQRRIGTGATLPPWTR